MTAINSKNDKETFSEWLFHTRKLKRRNKRHTTHTTKKETDK